LDGFGFDAEWYNDRICLVDTNNTSILTNASSTCYDSDFYLVTTLTENTWLNGFEIANIGGILGLGRNATGESSSFWRNSGVLPAKYSVSLSPSDVDWSWITGAPNMSDAPQSNIFFG
jgi:hypothetical protein